MPPDPADRRCKTDANPDRNSGASLLKRLAAWRQDSGGTAAVEFAFFAPALFFGLLGMVDFGLAINERMTLDHVLRAGAQHALSDPGETSVLNALNATAENNFTLATNNNPPVSNPLALTVTRFCACPNLTGTAVACSTICSGPKPTFIFYRLSGQKTYNGMLIPSITAKPSVQVQIR